MSLQRINIRTYYKELISARIESSKYSHIIARSKYSHIIAKSKYPHVIARSAATWQSPA